MLGWVVIHAWSGFRLNPNGKSRLRLSGMPQNNLRSIRSRVIWFAIACCTLMARGDAAEDIGALNADLVVTNANIITVDAQKPRAEALAVRDGRFVAVGSREEIAPLVGPEHPCKMRKTGLQSL